MAFKTIDATGRTNGRSASTAVEVGYYGKTAQFRLTPAAVLALGTPDRLELQFDDETRAIRLIGSEAKHAVQLRKDTAESQSRYFGFRSFAAMVGLPADGRVVISLEPSAEVEGALDGQLPEVAVAEAE